MNSALKWKLIAGFLLVFIAGGATGVFVTMAIGHHFMFGPHPHGFAAQAMKNRLRWQLRLTDEQMTKISPILDKAGTQLEEIRGDTGKRVRDVIVESHREIAQYLTPEQQQRLKQMEERRRQWMQQHHGPWHRGGPGGSAMPQTPTPEAPPQ
jgi:Spy/CpxP family protein refolding chaperone